MQRAPRLHMIACLRFAGGCSASATVADIEVFCFRYVAAWMIECMAPRTPQISHHRPHRPHIARNARQLPHKCSVIAARLRLQCHRSCNCKSQPHSQIRAAISHRSRKSESQLQLQSKAAVAHPNWNCKSQPKSRIQLQLQAAVANLSCNFNLQPQSRIPTVIAARSYNRES